MPQPANVLGIEGGATRTTVLLAGAEDEVLEQFTAGPANLRLMPSPDLGNHLHAIRQRLPFLPAAIGIGLAGARSEADLDRLRHAVARIWPGIPCAPTDDLRTALEAAEWAPDAKAQVLVLSGTGSCCLGVSIDGSEVKIGGRGHVLGDRASACHIAQLSLRAVMAAADENDAWPALGSDFLAHLQMNEPEDLIDWSLVAPKTELAGLAVPVFHAAESRQDDIAQAVLYQAADLLASDASSTAKRLGVSEKDVVQFVFNGAVLLKNPSFAQSVESCIRSHFPNAVVTPLARPSVWGAVALGRKLLKADPTELPVGPKPDSHTLPAPWKPETRSPTEERNPRTMELSDMATADAIRVILGEDATIADAVLAESEPIEWTINKVVEAFKAGGRLFYVGAGTSGRLGVLDASECPPTFRVDPDLVQGIIAGGRSALWSAVEGAEDDAAAGQRAIANRAVQPEDVVVGISASGHAPFLWGAMAKAKSIGASTVLLTCHPGYRQHPLPDRVIAVNTGPEVLTGSTRLRAGTATKLVLNLLTTVAMTKSGKVVSNLMIDLNPSNIKLRQRAIRIVQALTNCPEEQALQTLEESGWVVRDACRRLGLSC